MSVDHREFEFTPTPAVAASRAAGEYVECPVCGADQERYLFHKLGNRYVSCQICGVVYANPPMAAAWESLDVDRDGQHSRARDRELYRKFQSSMMDFGSEQFEHRRGRAPREVVLVGRTLDPNDISPVEASGRVIARLTEEEARRTCEDGDASPIARHIGDRTDVLVLNEVLEACPSSATLIRNLADAISPDVMVVVAFSNAQSTPLRLLRRWAPRFFPWRSVCFDPATLGMLMDRAGYRLASQTRITTPFTLAYLGERMSPRIPAPRTAIGLQAGAWLAAFERSATKPEEELLSVIMPVYNEERYVGDVLDAVLQLDLRIPKEVIVVESNSTDGTREVVGAREGRAGLTIIYEDAPSGKGAAVQRALNQAKGSIILIQDADFEYDLDDYDALIDPILQRRTSFVLGSRSLGLDDWKVRKMASSRIRGLLMNVAQLLFAKSFNLLYQQRTTDINTMFKVFRRECVDDISFVGRGFNFDIELVCKIVRNGFGPMEVPVNYVARGFDEGKKISFLTEFFPSYSMIYRCRWG
jgi:Glycosyl transferase family 2